MNVGVARALGMSFALTLGCSGGEAPASAPEPAAPAEAPTPAPTATPEGTPAAGTGSPADPAAPAGACERAQACCAAFVTISHPGAPEGDARQGCQALQQTAALGGDAANAACAGAVEGWRRSLAAMGRPIPEVCQ